MYYVLNIKKLKQVIILNEDRQFKLNKKGKELETSRNQIKKLAIDLKTCTLEKEKLEEENLILLKNMKKIQNYEEIHIEVDILSQSQPGVEILLNLILYSYFT